MKNSSSHYEILSFCFWSNYYLTFLFCQILVDCHITSVTDINFQVKAHLEEREGKRSHTSFGGIPDMLQDLFFHSSFYGLWRGLPTFHLPSFECRGILLWRWSSFATIDNFPTFLTLLLWLHASLPCALILVVELFKTAYLIDIRHCNLV